MNNEKNKHVSKINHIYQEEIDVGVYYTYDSKHNKVYDIKSLRNRFKLIIENLKKK